jgi:tetratricopeptide (TPR) repeat protein
MFSVLKSTMQKDNKDVFLLMHHDLTHGGSYAQAAEMLTAAVMHNAQLNEEAKAAAEPGSTGAGSRGGERRQSIHAERRQSMQAMSMPELLRQSAQLNKLAEMMWRYRAVRSGQSPKVEALTLLEQSLRLLDVRRQEMVATSGNKEGGERFLEVAGTTLAEVYQGTAVTYLLYTEGRNEDERIHELLTKALHLRQKGNQRAKEADTLNSFGMLSQKTGAFAQAEGYFNRSLLLRRTLADKAEGKEPGRAPTPHAGDQVRAWSPSATPCAGRESPGADQGGEEAAKKGEATGDAAHAKPGLKGKVSAHGAYSDVAQSCVSLGNLFHQQERYQEALLHMRSALEWYTAEFGPDHPKVCHAHEGIGRALHRLGRLEESQRYFSLAQSVREEVARQAEGREIMQIELKALYEDQRAVQLAIDQQESESKSKSRGSGRVSHRTHGWGVVKNPVPAAAAVVTAAAAAVTAAAGAVARFKLQPMHRQTRTTGDNSRRSVRVRVIPTMVPEHQRPSHSQSSFLRTTVG